MTVEKQHIDKRTLAIHILCWGFLVFVPSILRPSDSFDERIFHTLRSLGPSLCYMAVFYLNYLYLVPKIFLKHRRSTFIWVNIVLIVVAMLGCIHRGLLPLCRNHARYGEVAGARHSKVNYY